MFSFSFGGKFFYGENEHFCPDRTENKSHIQNNVLIQ